MRRKWFRLPPVEVIVPIAILEAIVNAIWYGIGEFAKIQSPARDWGFVVLSVVALVLLGWYLIKKAQPKTSSVAAEQPLQQPEWTATITNKAIIGQGFEFFPSRDILASHYTLNDRIKSVPTVWAIWHTGTLAWGQDAIKKGNLKHLILPNPIRGAPLDKIAELIGKDEPRPLIEDIVRVTKEVLAKRKKEDQEQSVPIEDRIEVRWYQGITTNSIMIGNPEPLLDDSWIQVETLMPMPANERPSFAMIYGQTPFKSLFEDLVEAYKNIWAKSRLTEDDVNWIQAFGKEK